MKRHKYERVLDIVFALENGKQLSKYELAATYEVDVRTIQRDIDDVRAYYSDAFLLLGAERSFMIGQVTGINSLHKVEENTIRIRNLFSVTLFQVYGMIGLQHISNGLQENTLCT